MSAARIVPVCLFFVAVASAVAPEAVYGQNASAGSGMRLVLPQREPELKKTVLLDVIRRRLPVVVQTGRFTTADGLSLTCIHGRRTMRRAIPPTVRMGSTMRDAMPATVRKGAPPCQTIEVFVDGVSIGGADSFLATTRARHIQSIELLTASEAMQRYGLTSAGSAGLDIWSRGRGPHARP